ncbi:hypothetical protein M2397_003270 [Pseudomonas sp. BIGb0381]|uniref:hypothetical protein n=1 Tax=Pseudomonas sp. BIGb0381 TaxID=2940608 RepID=UPI00216AAEE2|nr:hypothetical protein [Pseudomonas sp. BIGb0381]MCS4312967.1 hypothetical protein [Pseudomonas sp. BIGb0381]
MSEHAVLTAHDRGWLDQFNFFAHGVYVIYVHVYWWIAARHVQPGQPVRLMLDPINRDLDVTVFVELTDLWPGPVKVRECSDFWVINHYFHKTSMG